MKKWYDLTPGWIILYEEAFLQSLASTLPESSIIINVGGAVGTSTAAILRGVSHLEMAYVLSIDIKDCPEEIETLKKQGLPFNEPYFKQSVGNSLDIADRIKRDLIRGNRGPNLVFVDGTHDYEGAYLDLVAYSELLIPGGLLVCHDYEDKRQEGVTAAINEWRKENDWLVIGRVLYTIAFMKPGGDPGWTNGRVAYE
jgi:predicted O-methyltransferase YrrM